jgi:hypothetical protein
MDSPNKRRKVDKDGIDFKTLLGMDLGFFAKLGVSTMMLRAPSVPNTKDSCLDIETTIDAANMFIDILFYWEKLKPSEYDDTGWPLAASIRPSGIYTKKPSVLTVAPSIASTLKKIACKDGGRMNMPLVTMQPNVKVKHLSELWESFFEVKSDVDPNFCHPQIPVSTADHENSQLYWGRKSKATDVPIRSCQYGCECAAKMFVCNQGCLGVYLTPAEQDAFDSSGTLPENALFCLLCIRRDAETIYITNKSTLKHPQTQVGRGLFCVPPFRNLVDCPGGYKNQAIIGADYVNAALPASIVSLSNNMEVLYDHRYQLWYVDQTSLIFDGRKYLNGHAVV